MFYIIHDYVTKFVTFVTVTYNIMPLSNPRSKIENKIENKIKIRNKNKIKSTIFSSDNT